MGQKEKTFQEQEFSMEKIKELETDTECNSYSNKIGASSKLLSVINKKHLITQLINCLTSKLLSKMLSLEMHKMSIIENDSKMKLILKILTNSWQKKRRIGISNSMKFGPNKNNKKLNLLILMI